MIGLQNKDSSFFEIKLLNTDVGENVYAEDVVSLNVTEEMDKMTLGTLRLRDRDHLYSRVMRTGVLAEIAWGYKKWDLDLGAVEGTDVFSRVLERRGLRVAILNPGGSGGSDGAVYYNCRFMSIDIVGLQDHVVHSGGTKGSLITKVMNKIGVTNTDVRFARMNDPANARQWETDFQFLSRKAREWRTLFRIGRDPNGDMIGLFMDPEHLPNSKLAADMAGGSLDLYYNAGDKSNVLDYNWQNHEGENGAGDNVQMVMLNGEITFLRYTIENDKVRTWALSMTKIREAFDERDLGGFAGIESQAQLVQEVYEAKDFEDWRIKRFFDPIDQSTAPNGLGYTLNVHMLGNPAAAPPGIPTLRQGFPDRLRPRGRQGGGDLVQVNNLFYLRKATHRIDRTGYFTDLEIVDVYTLAPTGVLL